MKANDPDLKPGLLLTPDESLDTVRGWLEDAPAFKGSVAEVVTVNSDGESLHLWWPSLNIDFEHTAPTWYKKLK